jgi:Cu-Zn family superoxide dismutase
MRSRSLSIFAVAAAFISFAACGGETAAPPPAAETPALSTIVLPDSVSFPEGVAYDSSANTLYTSSALDGALVRVDPATGAVTVVTPAGTLLPADNTAFPGPLGMKIDDAKRLWIAGGRTGKIWIVNTADGSVVKDFTVPTAGKSLINDVTLAGGAGYFTDTFVPTLWRVAANGETIGDLEPWLDLQGSAIEYGESANLNGIASTPDGGTLIVVQMAKGLLFKIDVATKAVTAIDTAGADLSGSDGLVLDGNTLYVVRQTAVEIATVQLNDDLTAGTVTSRFKDAALAWPATAAKVGSDLIVVNTQFNTRRDNTTVRPFTLLRVPVARLMAQ